MAVTHQDSLDKIIKYFSVITKVPFTVGNKRIQPRPLLVSALLARGYRCHEDCGACCEKFTLDYLPDEDKPDGVKERIFKFERRLIRIYTDFQGRNTGSHCRHVSSQDGQCGIYKFRPFSCDFELVRCEAGPERLMTRISVDEFGRPWNMTRTVDKKKGALCEMLEPSDDSIKDTIRKLRRLEAWASHFGLTETWLPEIINFLQNTKGTKGNVTLIP